MRNVRASILPVSLLFHEEFSHKVVSAEENPHLVARIDVGHVRLDGQCGWKTKGRHRRAIEQPSRGPVLKE